MNKPHPPTRSRIRRALEEGDVPISRTVTRTAALLGVLLVAPALASAVSSRFRYLFDSALRSPEHASAASLPWDVLTLCGPALGVAFGAAVLATIAQTGGRLRVRFSSRNAGLEVPTNEGVGRAAVAACIPVALAVAALLALGASGRELRDAALATTSLSAAIGSALIHLGWALAATLVLAAVVDLVVARLSWLARLRMSRAELLEERRRTEGSPEARTARRKAHEALVRGTS